MSGEEDIAKAVKAAVRLLAGRSLTRQELVTRLARRFDAAVAEAAADRLERERLLSDRAAADSGARSELARGASRERAAERLLARGVDHATARRAVIDAAGGRDEGEAALDLARRRVRMCPAGLEPEAIRRRVFAYLARRGYDEDTARAAVERAVGEILPR